MSNKICLRITQKSQQNIRIGLKYTHIGQKECLQRAKKVQKGQKCPKSACKVSAKCLKHLKVTKISQEYPGV